MMIKTEVGSGLRKGSWKLQTDKKWILLWSLQKDLGLLTPCLQPSETDFQTSDLPSLQGAHLYCFKPQKSNVIICYSSLCKLIQPPFLKMLLQFVRLSPILGTPCHLLFASLPKSFCICNDFYNIYEQQPITLRTKPKSPNMTVHVCPRDQPPAHGSSLISCPFLSHSLCFQHSHP